jgi:5'-nucleotidase
MQQPRPLILVTNDDGIGSAGLWATVEAVFPLGEVLVAAPDRPWSGGGRLVSRGASGRVRSVWREVSGVRVSAYAVDASAVHTVVHGVLDFAPRTPSLVVSGINCGANLGTEVSISGTVCAALEAAALGVPALAVSQEMDPTYHPTDDPECDYAAAIEYTRRFARRLLNDALPRDVDVLNLNLPSDATPATPWCLTRLSRRRYFVPSMPDREDGTIHPGYRQIEDAEEAEEDSDVRAVRVEGRVSVTPLSLDLTARTAFRGLAARLGAPAAATPDPWAKLLDEPEGSLSIWRPRVGCS